MKVKAKPAPWLSTGLSHIPVLVPREPEVVVWVAASWFVQMTSVPTATTSSSRVKFSTSEATIGLGGEDATTGVGASGVVAGAACCGAGTDVAGAGWGVGEGAGAESEPQAAAARAINAAAASQIRDFKRRLTSGLLRARTGEIESIDKKQGLGSDVLPYLWLFPDAVFHPSPHKHTTREALGILMPARNPKTEG